MGSDEELMAAIAMGDATAFRELHQRHQQGLYRFVARYTGGRDVEDIVQETWLRVARAAPRFDPRRRFTTWCFQIAVNLCHDWFRRTRRAPAPTDDPPAVVASEAPRVDAGLDATALLAALPEGQRAVLVLRFYHDFSEAEIAETLEVPRGTVKSRMHGALARLRALVEADHADHDV